MNLDARPNSKEPIRRYLETVVAAGLYPSVGNLEFYLGFLFQDIDLAGKAMLEIGGGSGWLSLYARTRGASPVTCLEPQTDGSSTHQRPCFVDLSRSLVIDDVRYERVSLQAFDPGPDEYEIILLHNSINHLDEQACINLHRDAEARARYHALFERIRRLTRPGGTLVVTDCSRFNLFGMLHLKNPVAPRIEWHKHQPPNLWARLLSEHGFQHPRILWSSFNSLRTGGGMLLGNRFASFFLRSHFRLTMIMNEERDT